MPYHYDAAKGEYVYDDPLKAVEPDVPIVDTYGQSPAGALVQGMQQQDQAAYQKEMAAADIVAPDRPFIADSPGQAFSEIGKVLGNAGVGLLTDYGDIIAGLGDVAGETFNAVTGKGFDVDNIFNDADNPWTRARRETFAPETELGKQFGTLARVATALVALPKIAAKGFALPFQIASKVKVAGSAAEAAGGVGAFILKADDYMKALGQTDKVADAQKALSGLEKAFIKGSPAAKAAKNAAENSWLMLPLADVAKATAGVSELKGFANWAENVQQGVRGLTQLGAKSSAAEKIRKVGEALAWDSFVAFNVFGEGDDEMDATLSDAMHDAGLPVIPGLMTEAEDSAWARKAKQMVEGLAIGGAMNGLIDTYRTYKFAQAFKGAKPTEQAQIMKAFGLSAQEIGDSMGRQIAAGGDNVTGIRIGGKPDLPGDARAESIARMRADTAEQQARFAEAETNRPRGGALLSLREQLDRSAPLPSPQAAQMPPDPASPVQQFLAVAEGAASRINPDDARYAEWLGQPGGPPSAPGPLVPPGGPPPVPGQAALSGGEAPGAPPPGQVAGALPGGPEARPPGADPAGLLGAGGPPVPAGIEPVQVFDTSRPIEAPGALPPGSSPEARPPGANPAGLLGAGGPPADGAIRPVRVEDLGAATPRPPTAVVTPQTIKSAFAQDAYRVWQEAQQLTFQDVGVGAMKSLDELRGGVRSLMPQSRVDAVEYAMRFPVQKNAMGVVPASDSVWSNFISQKALSEGWARIDPDSLELYYNRKLAYELDRGEAVTKQAQALDEFDALSSYQETPIDLVESYRAGQQENPLPIDLNQSEKVAAAETDPVAAYDQWESRQAAMRGQADTAAEAVKAADQVDAIDAAESARLSAAERMKLSGKESPQQIVREMLGMDLDTAYNAEVVRAETTRGYNVIDRNGEQINQSRFPTKRQADSFAEKQNIQFREQLTSRARQMAKDGEEVAVSPAMETTLDNTITGKLTFTDAQEAAIKGIMPELDTMLNKALQDASAVADETTGLLPKRRTFELTQQQLSSLGEVLQGRINDGSVKGGALRSLRTLVEKIDRQTQELAPMVRAQRAVDDLLASVDQFDKHGEFCDFL
jgi:hypothetical protein